MKDKRKNIKNAYSTKLLVIVAIMILLTLVSISFASKNKLNKFSKIALKNDAETTFQNSINNNLNQILLSLNQNGTLTDDSGIVTAINTTKISTGTGPFDATEGAGNDTSADDNIVRSFDQVTYAVEATTAINNTPHGSQDAQTAVSFTGGYLCVKAVLPEECIGKVEWDLDSMGWAQETGSISADKRIFSAIYKMSSDGVTVPGKQELNLIVKVNGAENNFKFKPEVYMWLNGNETDESKSDYEVVKTSEITETIVSAAPKYNIRLKNNSRLGRRVSINYGEGNTIGRMYGYSITLQLYNDNIDKGMKGIEIPTGDITFDIDLKVTKNKQGETTEEDITNELMPILWNYKLNDEGTEGEIAGRSMNFGELTDFAKNGAPKGSKDYDRKRCVYDSGKVVMTQNGDKISIKVSDYKFDGTFPTYDYYYDKGQQAIYSKNIGCFSAECFQIFLPEPTNYEINDTYTLKVSDTNMKAITPTQEITEQANNSDDQIKSNYILGKQGKYDHYIILYNTKDKYLSSTYNSGDGRAIKGQEFIAECHIVQSPNADMGTELKSVNKLVKFDGDGIEPVLYNGTNKYEANTDGMTWNMWYVTKKDGSNWQSQEERNNANIEDLNIYNNMEDIPEGYICVGMFFESKDGVLEIPSKSRTQYIRIKFKIKEDAIVNKTYGITQSDTYWWDSLDRTTQTVLNKNATYPRAVFEAKNQNYINTEYNESGQIKGITHNGGYNFGQTVLAIAADTKVSKTVADITSNGETKKNYDISKNEYEVTFKIQPILTLNGIENTEPLTNATIKLIDTLPKGLKYVKNSSNTETEPEITENEDGTTTLTWNVTGCQSDKEITPVIYKTHIDENTKNMTQYNNVVVAECEEAGKTSISLRTSKASIQVVNLASHRLYKTVEEPIIEKNGMLHYKITYKNNTENEFPEFQLLDVLPYNGDNRNTSFTGTYTLDHLDINSEATLKVYTTDNTNIRTNANVKNLDLSTWTEESNIGNINKEATAIAIKGKIGALNKVIIDVYLKTANNNASDTYVNNATCQVSKATEEIKSANVKIDVIDRKITGTVWLDENEDGIMQETEKRLSNIELELLNKDGTEAVDLQGIKIPNVKTNENGEYKFTGLPQGEYIVKIKDTNYDITEKEVGTDNKINSKFDLDKKTDVITDLNSEEKVSKESKYKNAGLKIQRINITANKTWKDNSNVNGKRPTSIKLQLKNGEQIIQEKLVTGNTTTNEGWGYTFTDLPKYNSEGNEIVYIVDEAEVNANDLKFYTKKVEGNSMTNTFTVPDEKISVTVNKIWEDNLNANRKRPTSVKLQVKNGTKIVKEQEISGNVTTNEGWDYTFTDLPKYNAEGNEIVYTVDETEVNANDLKFYTKKVEGNLIKNTFTVPDEKISVTANKVWEDNSNENEKRPTSIKLQLKKGEQVIQEQLVTGNTTTNEGWSYTFTDLPKYDAEGNEIPYTVDETEASTNDLKFYAKRIEGNTITNVFTIPNDKISITVNKIWKDNLNVSGKRPTSIKLQVKNGQDIVQEQTITGNKTSEIWTYTFNELAKYDSKGNEIVYTVDEAESNLGDLEYYDKLVENDSITNTFKVTEDTVESKITKTANKEKIEAEDEEINYSIKYTATINKYIGSATVTITDKLPYEIDISKSDLNGGTYNKEAKTISWTQTIEDINTFASGKEKQILIDKEIKVVYINTNQTNILKNDIEGKIILNTTGKTDIKTDNSEVTLEIKPGKVITNHYLEGTTQKLAPSVTQEGKVGEEYTTEENKELLKQYDLVKIPENKNGKYKKEEQEVNYYYVKKKGTLIVEYIEKSTGNKLLDDKSSTDYVGEKYSTKPEEIKYYKLIEYKGEQEGEYKPGEQKVIYYYEKLTFNFTLNKKLSNITLNGENIKNSNELAKIEISSKEIKNTELKLLYEITIKNTGEIEGSCIVQDKIPKGFQIVESPQWKVSEDGDVTIESDILKPGEERTYQITLKWNASEETFGTIENVAKIIDTQNEAQYEENNKEDNEDKAIFILSVKTGENIQSVVLFIVMICIISIAIVIIK